MLAQSPQNGTRLTRDERGTRLQVFVKEAIKLGVDLVDVSSGGNTPKQKISVGPGYQVCRSLVSLVSLCVT